ncbi:hypothetical protein [Saccharomonospora sp. NB11]|uniref:hypothetical protein n=1 Tax=Saccharomonospora sp. NB11 TaxID=1642298 RepID=UPI0018D16DD2|nr:hypothetical protein [Saccharomonospora sp. NB11]
MAEAWYDALANEAANGVSATAAVGAVLGGPAGAVMAGASAAARVAAAAGAGGSWSFDPDEIDAVIAEWKALAEDLARDSEATAQAENLSYPPSNDQPSNSFIGSVSVGLSALARSNQSMQKYVQDFIEKLEKAKTSLGSADDAYANSLGRGADTSEV